MNVTGAKFYYVTEYARNQVDHNVLTQPIPTTRDTKFLPVLIFAIFAIFSTIQNKRFLQNINPTNNFLLTIYSTWEIIHRDTTIYLKIRNKTFRNGKRFTGKDRLKILHWKEHLQIHTRARCNCDRVTLAAMFYVFLCSILCCFMCQLHAVQFKNATML